jgi:hypothetical protein
MSHEEISSDCEGNGSEDVVYLFGVYNGVKKNTETEEDSP